MIKSNYLHTIEGTLMSPQGNFFQLIWCSKVNNPDPCWQCSVITLVTLAAVWDIMTNHLGPWALFLTYGNPTLIKIYVLILFESSVANRIVSARVHGNDMRISIVFWSDKQCDLHGRTLPCGSDSHGWVIICYTHIILYLFGRYYKI